MDLDKDLFRSELNNKHSFGNIGVSSKPLTKPKKLLHILCSSNSQESFLIQLRIKNMLENKIVHLIKNIYIVL
jgi:hypothetical protein